MTALVRNGHHAFTFHNTHFFPQETLFPNPFNKIYYYFMSILFEALDKNLGKFDNTKINFP